MKTHCKMFSAVELNEINSEEVHFWRFGLYRYRFCGNAV